LRESLLHDCSSSARIALRAILLGALHGPRSKSAPSYLSNQCTRTYAPKPRYAIGYWQRHGLRPQPVDPLSVIERRAVRFFTHGLPTIRSVIRCGDSRDRATFARLGRRFRWVITSPPYYGMKTYIPDQWLRGWFLGGPPTVDYSATGQLLHSGQEEFVAELAIVWDRVRGVCVPNATMVIRFGAINDRAVDPLPLLSTSLERAGWEITKVEPAGTARDGKRQADQFACGRGAALAEHDVWVSVRQPGVAVVPTRSRRRASPAT
jgi:hypothetical protein